MLLAAANLRNLNHTQFRAALSGHSGCRSRILLGGSYDLRTPTRLLHLRIKIIRPWRWHLSDWATSLSLSCIGEGNGNPLQCSCLENPRDQGAWRAAVYGVTQSRTRLKQLSSSSSSRVVENARPAACVHCLRTDGERIVEAPRHRCHVPFSIDDMNGCCLLIHQALPKAKAVRVSVHWSDAKSKARCDSTYIF